MSNKHAQEQQRWAVAKVGEIQPGDRKIVEIEGNSIGVFNVNGSYIGVLNICPHELGPVCQGRVGGTLLPSLPGEYHWGRDGEILFCPWHGWEFDLLTGKALTDKRRRLHLFSIVVEDDTIYVTQDRMSSGKE